MGIPGVTLPHDPIQDQPTYDAALAAFQAQPQVKVMFDNGAGGAPGCSVPGLRARLQPLPDPRDAGPAPGSSGRTGRSPARRRRRAAARASPGTRRRGPRTDFAGTDTGGGDLWTANPSYDWRQPPAGTAASYLTPPLGADTAIIGAGAVQAWIKASVPDVDLQVTISEVRPDGKETYVQSGYLRTSLRALDKRKSTLLEPQLSLRRDTAAKLPKGQFSKVVIPLYYEGHMYRAGSRIRVTISSPNGDQPVWAFAETVPAGQRQGQDRLQQEASVAADPAADPGSHGADAAAALPGAARRALPELRAVDVRKARRFSLGSPRRCFGSCASPPD